MVPGTIVAYCDVFSGSLPLTRASFEQALKKLQAHHELLQCVVKDTGLPPLKVCFFPCHCLSNTSIIALQTIFSLPQFALYAAEPCAPIPLEWVRTEMAPPLPQAVLEEEADLLAHPFGLNFLRVRVVEYAGDPARHGILLHGHHAFFDGQAMFALLAEFVHWLAHADAPVPPPLPTFDLYDYVPEGLRAVFSSCTTPCFRGSPRTPSSAATLESARRTTTCHAP